MILRTFISETLAERPDCEGRVITLTGLSTICFHLCTNCGQFLRTCAIAQKKNDPESCPPFGSAGIP